MLTTTSPSYVNDCGRPLKRPRCSPHQRQRDRSGTMIRKLMPFHWSQVTWPWLKLTPMGGGRWRIGGRRNHMKWSAKLWKVSLPTSWKTNRQDAHKSSTEMTFSHYSDRGDSSLYCCAGLAGQVHQYCPRGINSGGECDWESTTKGKLSIVSPESDRWDSSTMDEQEILCVHADVSQSFLDR